MVRVKSIFFVKFQVWSVPITGRLGSLLATVVKLDIRGTVFRLVWMLYLGIEHRLDRRRKHICTELVVSSSSYIYSIGTFFLYLPCMGRNVRNTCTFHCHGGFFFGQKQTKMTMRKWCLANTAFPRSLPDDLAWRQMDKQLIRLNKALLVIRGGEAHDSVFWDGQELSWDWWCQVKNIWLGILYIR